jgi:hypothetical protein
VSKPIFDPTKQDRGPGRIKFDADSQWPGDPWRYLKAAFCECLMNDEDFQTELLESLEKEAEKGAK